MTILMNQCIKSTKIMLPMTLNITWATATRRAVKLARKEASTAVIQVPMLSPKSTGIAPSSGMRPWPAMAIKIPMVALLDWMSTVITVPMKMPSKGLLEKWPMKSTKPG